MNDRRLKIPPRGIAVLAALGPGLMWCGEYIGSGEVILAPRAGAVLGLGILWVPVVGIFSKYWIGFAGATYTVTTGEGMIDMMSRAPGPRNWALWPVFVGQCASAAISTAGIAGAAGIFAATFIPIDPHILGWIIMLFVMTLVWCDRLNLIQKIMSVLVLTIILGVCGVAFSTWPGLSALLSGIFGFQIPEVPAWAIESGAAGASPWNEILPLLGWAAGGFASQVWYTYWVMGAGHGMTAGRGYGKPLDEAELKSLTPDDAKKILGWRRVVAVDATFGMVVGVVITIAFAIAGAGVLRPAQIAPEGPQVASELSRIFGENWGVVGANLYILAGLAAMMSTLLGQLAGWPRLLADCSRILFPRVRAYPWKTQFRFLLVAIAFTNMALVYQWSLKPLVLVKLGAILDGLLLTPLQAMVVGIVLYKVTPKFFSEETRRVLKTHPVFAVGLAWAFLLFSYFCVFQIPKQFG